jgi:hypothetical protein
VAKPDEKFIPKESGSPVSGTRIKAPAHINCIGAFFVAKPDEKFIPKESGSPVSGTRIKAPMS